MRLQDTITTEMGKLLACSSEAEVRAAIAAAASAFDAADAETVLRRAAIHAPSQSKEYAVFFLRACITAAEEGVVGKMSAVLCVEDVIDCVPMEDMGDVFGALESLGGVLGAWQAQKQLNLALLRTCNAIVKRALKGSHTVLCGRVLMFLSSLFKLTDRSGVNVKGQYGQSVVVADWEEAENASSGKDAAERDESGERVDRSVFEQFWHAQKTFYTEDLAQDPSGVDKLAEGAASLMDVFDAQPKSVLGEAALGSANSSSQYLTSPALLHLQLRDPSFQSHVLIQCTIAEGREEAVARLEEKLTQLYARIEKASSKGKEILRILRLILERETHWMEWKAGGCVSYEKPRASDLQSELRRRVSAGMQLTAPSAVLHDVISENRIDHAALTDDQRDRNPNLADFLAPLREQLDPDAGIEEEYLLKNDPVYRWRALRLVGQHDVSLIHKNDRDVCRILTAMEAEKDAAQASADGNATHTNSPGPANTTVEGSTAMDESEDVHEAATGADNAAADEAPATEDIPATGSGNASTDEGEIDVKGDDQDVNTTENKADENAASDGGATAAGAGNQEDTGNGEEATGDAMEVDGS